MNEAVTSIAYQAFLIVVSALAAMSVALVKNKLGTEKLRKANEAIQGIQAELDTKESLAVKAVRWAEQKFPDMAGPDKYKMAAQYVADEASRLGLKISAKETEVLIESGLRALKEAYSEAWDKAINETSQE